MSEEILYLIKHAYRLFFVKYDDNYFYMYINAKPIPISQRSNGNPGKFELDVRSDVDIRTLSAILVVGDSLRAAYDLDSNGYLRSFYLEVFRNGDLVYRLRLS